MTSASVDPVRSLLLASISLIALVTAPARAADCGNVTAKGVCQDAKTLVFCEEGELETIRCQEGELCAFDSERFNGAAGCIASRYAGCGAVPEQGLCAGSTLLYCANNRVEELECPAGTACEAVVGSAADFDCVVQSAMSGETKDTPETPVNPGEDSDNIDEPTAVETNDGAPLPTVEQGGAGPAADYDVGGAGCNGGFGSAFALLGLALLRRR